jgi:UDP-N-acetylglucosamine--N-acetylmuramyl-(pentapeptide) pyrophosphoryl-undecaprenol N-acetylglucosamine transferase
MEVTKDDVLWIGTQGEIEESLVPKHGLQLETIVGGAIVGVPWRERIVNVTKLAWSLGKASRIMGSFKPDVLFMTGGYVNAPVSAAAWIRRVPSVIYLPDVEPGMAIRELSRFAKRVACTTEDSLTYFKSGKGVVTGYPVREIMRDASRIEKGEALANFNLKDERQTLFIFGGSRGARSINRALMASLPQLLDQIQVIHISGMLDWEEVKDNRETLSHEQQAHYRAYPYLHDEMGFAFRSADLVLARAGASMLGECPAFGLPAVLVPYPHAWRYQKVNADYLADRGAAIRVSDQDLADQLAEVVLDLLLDEERLEEMALAAASLDTPDSAEKLARLLIDVSQGAVK